MKYKQDNTPIAMLSVRGLVLGALACGLGLAAGCSNDDLDGGADGAGSKSATGDGAASGTGSTGNSSGDGDGATSGTGSTGSSSGDGDGDSSGDGDGDSSGDGDGDGDSSGDGDGDGGTSTDPNNSACGLAGALASAPGPGASIDDFEECGGVSYEAEGVAADILIMVDQSTSMGDWNVSGVSSDVEDGTTRWEALTDGLREFISSDKAQDLRIGLVYFGLPPSSEKDLQEGRNTSCEASDYAKPDVAIGLVSDNEADLLDSLDDHFPSNLTPTVPALEGALIYAKEWAGDHPERPTVLVLATDGYPTECENKSISDLEDLAEEYANPTDGSPRVSTFVIGIGKVANLERVATAGGSQQAFFVGDCPTAVEDLTASLLRVASSSALCEFEVPEAETGKIFDPDMLNMVFTPKGSPGEIVYRRDSVNGCGSGGWYYDDNDDPQMVLVCPETCNSFGGGVVDVVVGCKSRTLK